MTSWLVGFELDLNPTFNILEYALYLEYANLNIPNLKYICVVANLTFQTGFYRILKFKNLARG